MLAFYNGADTAQTCAAETAAAGLCVLYGNPEATLADGRVEVLLPPNSLAIFAPDDGTKRGVIADGICYAIPKAGGVIRCESDAMVAHYESYGGVRELKRLYLNGETVMDGEGEIQFFRWDKMQPR